MRRHLLKEKYSGELAVQFGQDGTCAQLNAFYFWPSM